MMNLGLLLLFLPMIVFTHVRRGRTPAVLKNLDLGGWRGCGNIEVTGAGGSTFHMEFEPGIVRVGFGSKSDAVGTVSISLKTLFQLLSGRGSFASAMMTGQMRIKGDGHLSFLMGALASQFQAAATGKYPGVLAVLGPLWAKLVLALSEKSFAGREV